MENPSDLFGEYVFDDSMMQKRLPKETYKALKRTIEQGRSLDPAVAGVVMLGLSLLLETPSLPGSPKVWAAALFLGVFCSGICFVIQSVEQQFTTASHASLIFTLEPVFSAVFAYFLLSERLTVRGYFGAALMLVSLLIMELDVPALLKKDEKAP